MTLQPVSIWQCSQPQDGQKAACSLAWEWLAVSWWHLVAGQRLVFLRAAGSQPSHPRVQGLELCHLPVGVCLALCPLQACLLGPELPQLPLGSRQLLLQLGHCHAVPRERPSVTQSPRLLWRWPVLPPTPRASSEAAHRPRLGRALEDELWAGHPEQGWKHGHPGPRPLQSSVPLPASVAGEGLLDASDVPLGLLDLLLRLEEPQAQGTLGVLAGVVHLLAAPPPWEG